jgi:hypothetical protein
MLTREDEPEPEPDGDEPAPRPRRPSAYKLFGSGSSAPARALPRLIFETLRVAWRAGRRELLILVGADASC